MRQLRIFYKYGKQTLREFFDTNQEDGRAELCSFCTPGLDDSNYLYIEEIKPGILGIGDCNATAYECGAADENACVRDIVSEWIRCIK